MILADALDTLWTLLLAGGLWLLLLAATATLALYSIAAIVYGTVRLAWRAVRGPHRPAWARSRTAAARWARREPDYEEAA
ncbi:hypothetical protein [Streptomyces sp. SGAir0924]|uniref:hypothetical protein n=1 Tax=Streptomyces sp. SGAir0924 TaxID=2109593 RepID=UPI0010CD30E3|nr:hypothetical protein [Streptomyces sp. SGAir0924]QCR49844.1 hypothetical protein C1N79_26315 [Streptomyces sp. SGAir0924]